MAAVHVVGRTRQREIGEPEFLIGADERPEIRVARVRPRVFFPRLVARVACLRDDVKGPAWLAGVHVERLNISRRLHFGLRRVGHRRSHHHDVATALWPAARLIDGGAWTETFLQAHASSGAPRRDRSAVSLDELDEILPADSEQSTFTHSTPIGDRARAA